MTPDYAAMEPEDFADRAVLFEVLARDHGRAGSHDEIHPSGVLHRQLRLFFQALWGSDFEAKYARFAVALASLQMPPAPPRPGLTVGDILAGGEEFSESTIREVLKHGWHDPPPGGDAHAQDIDREPAPESGPAC